MNKFRLITSAVKTSKGFNPSITIKSRFAPNPFTFDHVVKNTDQEARSFASMEIAEFREFEKANPEKFLDITEWGEVDEAHQFFKKANAPGINV